MLAPIAGPTTISRAGDGTPLVTAAAGTSLHDLMATLLGERLFVPVTPGTRYVTVGGAVAADIHGKNHHRDGTFGAQVVSLDLVTADGGLHAIGPDTDAALFWATVGGMGLTGVITSVTLRALEVESAYVTVHTERIAGLDELMRTMREHDDDHRYSVAWIDTLARGRSLGRSVLTRGDHATEAELTGAAVRHPWRAPRPPRLAVPLTPPGGLVSRPAVRAFNELWFRKAPRDRVGVESIASFFHPLDQVGSWNRLYGRGGLVQYQLVVPEHAEDALTEALQLLSDAGQPSFLAVLKRFGATNPGLLSFPMHGWTLALDLPAGPALGPLFRALDRLVVEAGGQALPGQGLPALAGDLRPDVRASRGVPKAPPGARPGRRPAVRPRPPPAPLTPTEPPNHRTTEETMLNALGEPQSLLLLGGTSDIALAVAEKYAASGGLRVVLAARPGPRRTDAAARLTALGHTVEELDFEATDTDSHPALVAQAAAGGDLDVVLVAFGVLGDEEEAWQDHDAAVRLAEVNYVGPVSVGTALAQQVRRQGHGSDRLPLLSGRRAGAPLQLRLRREQGRRRRLLPRPGGGAARARRTRARRPPWVRAHQDDRGPRGGSAVGGTRRGRGRRGRWRRRAQGAGLGAGRDAGRDVGAAARPSTALPPTAALIPLSNRR